MNAQWAKEREENKNLNFLLCLIIFIASIVAGGYVGYYSYINGDPELLVAPLDADGNFCGRTPGYENFSKLYYQNID